MLAIILSGQPFREAGAPERASPLLRPIRDLQNTENRDVDTIVLALSTLGTFDFRGIILSEFLIECVVLYLEDDYADIRKTAALTCCKVLAREQISPEAGSEAMKLVADILERLLVVAIADAEADIRQEVLMAFTEAFDYHLAQAGNLKSLFVALNDEVFAIREITLTILGRLAEYNPAYVLPSLRKILIQILTAIEYSGMSRVKEENSRLLAHLIRSAPNIIRPYVDAIVKNIMPKVKDASPAVSAQLLVALGRLAKIAGQDLLYVKEDLLPIIIENLQDQTSSTKREAALRSLGQVVSSTGCVIEPYIAYPDLLEILSGMLKTETLPPLRKNTIKVIGILGALDPYRHKMISLDNENTTIVTSAQLRVDAKSTAEETALVIDGSNEDYYPMVAIRALMKILKDSALSAHHTNAVQGIMYIFKALGLRCVPFLPQVRVYISVSCHVTDTDLDYTFATSYDQDGSCEYARVLLPATGRFGLYCSPSYSKLP